MSIKLRNIVLVSIVIISTLMHLKHFSKDLLSIHVWRQTQTQSTIDNFYKEDMNILNPRRNDRGDTDGIFRMEFPLMQWLVACQYKIFGYHLIISRIFMFIVGFFSILGIYKLLKSLFNNTMLAIMGAWAFNFSPSFYYYTINPLPDNLALCCSVWGLALFFSWLRYDRLISLIFCGVFLSIGALCKLPFIVYYIVPFVYFLRLVLKKGIDKKVVFDIISVMGLSLLPIIWYINVIPTWEGNPVLKGMLNNKESLFQLFGFFQHNLISNLPELLLNYGSLLFFLAGFYYFFKRKSYKDARFILIISLCVLVLVYYFFEANAIANIHDYYLFPFYPLLFILVAYGAFSLYDSNIKLYKYLTIFLLSILPLTCYIRMHTRWDTNSPGFNSDLLIYKTELRNAVPNDALVVAGNDESHFIFFYYIDKKGWGFHDDNLTSNMLKTMIEKGAKYLYVDSKILNSNIELAPYLDKMIMEKGTIKVYSLKK